MRAVLAKLDASTRDIAASHCHPALAGVRNIGSAAGKLGDHSRSGTGASRRTVALNSSRVGGDRHAPHPARPSFRRRLAGLAAALVAFGAAPTFGGIPGWPITLIAAVAALLAATVAVLLDRAWAGRRKAITAPPEPCTLLDGSGEEAVRQHHAALGVPCGDVHRVASLT
jgi:hypothetical protein